MGWWLDGWLQNSRTHVAKAYSTCLIYPFLLARQAERAGKERDWT